MSTTERDREQASVGAQYPLVLKEIPAAADRSLIGTKLTDAGALTVAGDYYCLIPMAGLFTGLYVHLTATIGGGTLTSDINTTYYAADGTLPSARTSYQAFTGDGALATATLQTSSLTTLKGERWAVVKLTIATGPSTFTRGEYNGV